MSITNKQTNTMKDLKQILEAVELVTVTNGNDLDSKLVVKRGFMEFQISRRLKISSQTLLPRMDVNFYDMNDEYLGGFSGNFVRDEEAVMLNKMFIDADTESYKEKSKLRQSKKDMFWNEINK